MARKVEVESEYGFDLENRDPLDKNPHVRVSKIKFVDKCFNIGFLNCLSLAFYFQRCKKIYRSL